MVDVDELFNLPLEEFTAARDALAKQLKKAGDAGAAAEVKALRKPTVSAWAVNQAVRRSPDVADELVDAAAELRAAQTAAVEGGDAAALRDAMKAHRAAVARMLDEVRDVGITASAQLERATATLQATASSPAAAEAVRDARLTGDLDPSGFGEAGGLSLVGARRAERSAPSPDAASGAKTKARPVPGARKADSAPAPNRPREKDAGRAVGDEKDDKARRKREEAEARAAELAREADEAETEAGLAEAEAERLAEEADELEAQAKDARRAATEARHAAAEARSAADGARRRAGKAAEKAARR